VGAVRLTLAYDGTDFSGWQRQPGQRTVAGVVEEAVTIMTGHPVRLRAASRTDAGVHALGQVVSFDTGRDIPVEGWVRGLDGALPDDVAIRDVDLVEKGWDPRRFSSGKHYRYLLKLREPRDPLLRHRAWHVGRSLARRDVDRRDETVETWLDVERMREAAAVMVGEHDFRAFKARNDPREQTVRRLTAVEVETPFEGRDDLVAIHVRGTAFLKHMVRIMVGTLVESGRGRFEPERVRALLSPDARREDAGPTAPPQGLTLVSVQLTARPLPSR